MPAVGQQLVAEVNCSRLVQVEDEQEDKVGTLRERKALGPVLEDREGMPCLLAGIAAHLTEREAEYAAEPRDPQCSSTAWPGIERMLAEVCLSAIALPHRVVL